MVVTVFALANLATKKALVLLNAQHGTRVSQVGTLTSGALSRSVRVAAGAPA